MKSKLLDQEDGRRAFVLVFDIGDEVIGGLLNFAKTQDLDASHITAIGALRDVTLGYWDWDTKEYQRIPIREQVEVLSLVGNITLGPDGSPKVHAHVVLGKSDGTAHGGHLLEGHVRPTLEVVLIESPAQLRRKTDATTGLALIGL